MSMIIVQKAKMIEDEKMRKKVLDVIDEREMYYKELFSAAQMPEITVRFENLRPFRLRITFRPPGKPPIRIDIEGFTAPDVVTRHAFKKLRRVAKNHFDKEKKLRHRDRRTG